MKLNIPRFMLVGLVLPLTLYSFVAALFLTWSSMIYGVVAFALMVVCAALTGTGADRSQLREAGWKRSVLLGLAVAVLASAVALVLSARTTGVCNTSGLPVFAARERYFLTNHGALTEVSRLRFLIVGASFVTAWHSLILLAGLACLFQATQSSPQTPSR